MKPFYLRIGALAVLAVGVGSLFQNCSNARFDSDQMYSLDGQNSISGSGEPGDNNGGGSGGGGTVNVVCDPFDKKNIIDPKMGVEGRIYSAGSRLNATGCAGGVCTSHDYITMGQKTNAALFMSRIFVPTRDFTDGFGAEDKKVTDSNNNVLFEWFALDMVSNLILEDSEADGMYQYAIISDDGATLSVGGSDIIVHEGEHAPSLKCANQVTIHKKGEAVPFQLTYFQGPRTQISLVLLKRKVAAGQSLTNCGTSDGYIADADNLPATLKSKGWSVVKPGNFKLTNGSNLCATK